MLFSVTREWALNNQVGGQHYDRSIAATLVLNTADYDSSPLFASNMYNVLR